MNDFGVMKRDKEELEQQKNKPNRKTGGRRKKLKFDGGNKGESCNVRKQKQCILDCDVKMHQIHF